MVLLLAMGVAFLAGCTDSSQQSVVKEVGYDPVAEVANYKLGDLSEADKDYVVKMGYRDCDHMVASIIGQKAGIYDALGLNVEITKTGKILEAMASGELDVGYQGLGGAIRSVNQGAPLFMAAANHLGGSEYLTVSSKIQKPEDLIGASLAIGSSAELSPEWRRWARDMEIPYEIENYEVLDMGDKDSVFAMKSGQLDAMWTCDPYASQAEYEGFGRIIDTSWGVAKPDPKDPSSWGMCCIYCMNSDFYIEHPELANRMVLAHGLALQYIYQHPYNAAMMFADGFGTEPEVALKTIYMKTCKEGRTLTWQFSDQNIKNYVDFYYEMEIPKEEIPEATDINKFMSTDLLNSCGIQDFETFIKEANMDGIFPIGMDYDDWLAKAEAIDGIE